MLSEYKLYFVVFSTFTMTELPTLQTSVDAATSPTAVSPCMYCSSCYITAAAVFTRDLGAARVAYEANDVEASRKAHDAPAAQDIHGGGVCIYVV